MPTGYTAKIATGEMTTLREYALEAAKAFSVEMRDAPPGAVLPRRVEADTAWHDGKLAEAEARLAELEGMTDVQKEHHAAKHFSVETAEFRERLEAIKAQEDRYEAMKTAVKNWNGPKNLKTFMLEQLVISIDGDCDTSYMDPPKKRTAAEWYQAEIDRAVHDLEHHGKERAAAIARAAETNAWLAQLWASLPPE